MKEEFDFGTLHGGLYPPPFNHVIAHLTQSRWQHFV